MSVTKERAALHRIIEWADAYPLQVFPKPDAEYLAKAARVLAANGMTLDRINADTMRHVLSGVRRIAKDALH